jgi:uncharacterized protein (DUF952 family)
MDSSPVDWIVHLCPQPEWRAALQVGEYRPQSLSDEDFIHCSRPGQVVAVANLFFPGASDLILLWIDPSLVSAEIRWEAVDNQVFPHIYGPLNTEAVRTAREFVADTDGIFRQSLGL